MVALYVSMYQYLFLSFAKGIKSRRIIFLCRISSCTATRDGTIIHKVKCDGDIRKKHNCTLLTKQYLRNSTGSASEKILQSSFNTPFI